MTMKMTAIGRAALKAREGERLKAYRCSRGVLTIGVGHTSAAGEPRVFADFTTSDGRRKPVEHRRPLASAIDTGAILDALEPLEYLWDTGETVPNRGQLMRYLDNVRIAWRGFSRVTSLWKLLVQLDVLANALLGGNGNQTISERMGRYLTFRPIMHWIHKVPMPAWLRKHFLGMLR